MALGVAVTRYSCTVSLTFGHCIGVDNRGSRTEGNFLIIQTHVSMCINTWRIRCQYRNNFNLNRPIFLKR